MSEVVTSARKFKRSRKKSFKKSIGLWELTLNLTLHGFGDEAPNFPKFTGKHLSQSLCFDKVAGLKPPTLLKK